MSGGLFDQGRLVAGLEQLAGMKIFCLWKAAPRPDSPGKADKLPYGSDGRILKGRFDSPELQAKLLPMPESLELRERMGLDGVGIAFFPGCGAVGLDLDDCIVDGKLRADPEQLAALECFKPSSFIELSYSGSGLHAIAAGNAVTNKLNGRIELFGDRNFLALTGRGGRGFAQAMPESEISKVSDLIDQLRGQQARSRTVKNLNSDLTAHLKSEEGQVTIEEMRSALRVLDPGCDRDTWMRIVWGIRHGLGDTPEALQLADQWSRGGLHA